MTANLKIVHESETQRQHVRIKMPGHVKIGEKTFKIRDISAGGLSVETDGPMPSPWEGIVRIVFPFPSYAFRLECSARLIHQDIERKFAGYQFVDLDQTQISLLHSVLNACIAGTVVTGGDLLQVASRNNFVELKPKNAAEKKGAAKRILPTLFLLLVAGAAAAFMLGNVYEGSIILKSYQGVVESDRVTVRTHAEGRVRLLVSDDAERVTKDQPLAAIERLGAPSHGTLPAVPDEVIIKSPCDCIIEFNQAQDGEFVAYGERLFTLVPAGSIPRVATLVSPEKAHRLRLQDDVNIRIAGESGFIVGNITQISALSMEKPFTKITIAPESDLPVEMLGRPVYIEFTTY